jgi:hypothetical protein
MSIGRQVLSEINDFLSRFQPVLSLRRPISMMKLTSSAFNHRVIGEYSVQECQPAPPLLRWKLPPCHVAEHRRKEGERARSCRPEGTTKRSVLSSTPSFREVQGNLPKGNQVTLGRHFFWFVFFGAYKENEEHSKNTMLIGSVKNLSHFGHQPSI